MASPNLQLRLQAPAAPLSSVSSPRGFWFWFQRSVPQPAPEWIAWPSVVAAERICGVFLSLHRSGSCLSVVAAKKLFGFPLRYPSDADKHLLARQTGLSRNQVSNWFINARVRLWKPMVEEMYQQEAKEREEKELEENQKEDCQQTNNSSNNKDTKPNESNFTLIQTITAQTPTTTMMTPTPHENDSSFVPSSVVTAAPHSVSDAFTAATCQQDVSDHFQVDDGVIRFGTKQAGDVSLTLGLRHTGNMPDNNNPSFSVRDFGDF